ncbi:hypothetical protein LCGC14_2166770 [marine sediment metagenome]|uniref:Uncharacterized protein n=1 Tax=marine sediment metagenome TaxID=412755 RepID=A0A0F9GMB6_9ZZZZ
MKDYLKIMITVIFIIVIFVGVLQYGKHKFSKTSKISESTEIIKEALEKAYMEGQKDVFEDDIRIEKYGYDWIWIKSPWNDNTNPVHKFLSEYK